MSNPKNITIDLGGVKRRLVWGPTARYRLGTLPRPPRAEDLTDERKFTSAFISLLWAAIQNNSDLADPEAVAEALPEDVKALQEIRKQFWKLFPTGDQEKNAGSSTPGPSPASS